MNVKTRFVFVACSLMLVCSFQAPAQAQDALSKFHLTTPATSSALNISKDSSDLEVIFAPVETSGLSYFFAAAVPMSTLDLITFEPTENKKNNFRLALFATYQFSEQPTNFDNTNSKALSALCAQLGIEKKDECTLESIDKKLGKTSGVAEVLHRCMLGPDGENISKKINQLRDVELSSGDQDLDPDLASKTVRKATKLSLAELDIYTESLSKSDKKADLITYRALKSVLDTKDKCNEAISSFLLIIGADGRKARKVNNLTDFEYSKAINPLGVPEYTTYNRRFMLGGTLSTNSSLYYGIEDIAGVSTISQEKSRRFEYSPGIIVDYALITNDTKGWSVYRLRGGYEYGREIKSKPSKLCNKISVDEGRKDDNFDQPSLCEDIVVIEKYKETNSAFASASFLHLWDLFEIKKDDSKRKLATEIRTNFSFSGETGAPDKNDTTTTLSLWLGAYLMPNYGEWEGLIGLAIEPTFTSKGASIDVKKSGEAYINYQAFVGLSF